ncbi:DUF305 domain-containing protein [Halalkalicoccus tibetensis]|uniref:DUF305 domain-containing protein n=1 Tax=Halalkalicoccus tibetensis TaxID=175632 RepID=A0ABD5UXG3_9EURY
MTNPTTRRRVLYALGAASTVGIAGYGAAAEDGEEPDHEHDHHGDGDHDEHDHHEHEEHDEERHEEYDGEFNHADVEFMRMMIVHHEQAIEMAKLIPGRTDRCELRELGPEIIDVQEEEIEQMHEWLAEAGADPDHADHMDHGEMEGMLSEEELQELRCAEGREFDCLFVEGMIVHHEGAIEMSEDVLEDGRADRVADLAEEVIEVQEAEIEQMEDWQDEWGC